MASFSKSWVSFSACAAFLVFVYFAVAPQFFNIPVIAFHSSEIAHARKIQATKHNVWTDLTPSEADDVVKFLLSRADLNLTKAAKATSRDNTIMLVEVLKPNKTDVLAYLNGLSGPPARWARAAVARVGVTQSLIVNYMIGPLPLKGNTLVMPLNFCYNSDRNYVLNPLPDPATFQDWQSSFIRNHSDIIQTLLGVEGIDAGARITFVEKGSLSFWVHLYQRSINKSNAISLLPQGLYIKVEGHAVDPVLWRVSQWYYNGILYTSTSMLRDAMNSPGFEICPHNRDGNWTDTEDLTDGDPGRRLPPPVMIQPQGPRFAIDKKQNFISWMGFEFFISTSSDTGVALHDIRFNGDSVIYELGLQEALSHYAGNDPALSGLLFLDTLFFMGSTMFELVPGYDCPAYAAFLPTTFNQRESTTTVPNSICIFEYTADYPLQRHTADYRVSVSRNTYLVVRSVSTVGNYDYTIEYIFYLDGTVEVKYRASGYIITAFWSQKDNKDNEYGYRIHDAVSSSMHDHVLNFKADLDVDGTSNTLTRVAIEPISRQFSWDEEQAPPRNTMHLVKRPVEKETGIDWPRNSGEMYIVTNENSTNVWGEKRGYRIQPGTGIGAPPHLSILNSTALGRSAGWSSSDIWVVKQKDNEPKSASHLNFLDPFEPLVDFSKFVDGESTLQEDLVLYFNLGSHHVPHSGDIPNTLSHTAASSVMFTPFNFHDRDPSRRSVQGVQLELDGHAAKAKYFGGRNDKDLKLQAVDMEPDLSHYTHGPHTWTNMTMLGMLLGN